MSARTILLILLVTFLLSVAATQAADSNPQPVDETAADLLTRSIAYHDPNDAWADRPIKIAVEITLAERLADERGYSRRLDHVEIDNAQERFRYLSSRNGDELEVNGQGNKFSAKLNGRSNFSDAEREKHGLAPERLVNWRNYYGYMFGLPMKLRDPGTRIDPQVVAVEFNGQTTHRIRVTYDPEVGQDIWYFYFDPQTAALRGCRFFHDEATNDGEFITYEGEVVGPAGLRIAKIHGWHMNVDGEWIANDVIKSIDGS